MSGDELRAAIVACLPKRMPGREVTVVAAELGQPVERIQEELLAMEGREVLRKGRRGHQRWYRGPLATPSSSTSPVERQTDALW